MYEQPVEYLHSCSRALLLKKRLNRWFLVHYLISYLSRAIVEQLSEVREVMEIQFFQLCPTLVT